MENREDLDFINNRIINLYENGHSIKFIVDDVFKYSNSHRPKTYSFKNYVVDHKKEYTRLDCNMYVSKTIMNYNRTRNSNIV